MDKQMYSGDWKCCGCGKAITELPFEPKMTNNLTCRECYASGKIAPKSAVGQGEERQMFEGNWECSKCGCPINKLPFEPKATNNLTCVDCFKKSKGL